MIIDSNLDKWTKGFVERLLTKAYLVSETIRTSVQENFESNIDFQTTFRKEKDEQKEIDLKTRLEFQPQTQITIAGTSTLVGPLVANIVADKKNIQLIKEDNVGVGSLGIQPNACILKWRLRTQEDLQKKINCILLK